MSCFLCDSYYHVTQYCDKYISDEDRKNIILTKRNSLTNFSTVIASKKCYICCSRSHNTLFCPNRSTAPNLFIPNIDQNLFPRFLAVFDPYEKILLASQSPAVFNDALQPLTIIKTIKYNQYTAIPNIETNIAVCKSIEFCQDFIISHTYWMFYKRILSNTCIVLSENIIFSHINISSNILFALLSSKTKVLKFLRIGFLSEISFDEIFKYAPNLEEFEFHLINPMHDRWWQSENYFQSNYGKKFKCLKIFVTNYFDVIKLRPFMNKGPSNIKVEVYVTFFSQENDDRQHFLQKLSNVFTPGMLSHKQSFSLYFRRENFLDEEYKCVGSFS